MADKNTGTE